jgi:S1-C subfamily serine protease
VIRDPLAGRDNRVMDTSTLGSFSEALADIVAAVAPQVVQVQGRRRPASGVVYAANSVITSARALGRDDHLKIRTADDRTLDAELAGWDPATGLAVLRTADLGVTPAPVGQTRPRVGNIVVALARSWSNAITASTGIVAIIGGPLRTGRRRSIDEVIRTTAPMHDGFAGGPLIDTSGRVIGISTASEIRGLGVVIPASIAWASAAGVLQHGSPGRGFLGLAGQQVRLTERQAKDVSRERGLLILGVTGGSPADQASVLVGDILLDFDGRAIESPEELLDLLSGDRVGRSITARLLRGGSVQELAVTVGKRPAQ